MPRMMPMTDDMTVTRIPGPGTFEFSAVRPEQLGATEYTLVTVVVDETSSVAPFADDLLKTVKAIVAACQKSPRAENMMIRLLRFNETQTEVHGFKPLSAIDPAAYPPFRPCGMTALYDAMYAAVGGTLLYGKLLADRDFEINGAVYVITDGQDNASGIRPDMIGDKIRQVESDPDVESMITVLVGLKAPGSAANGVSQSLQTFQKQAGLTRYVDVGDATPSHLARLARFVSQSISSQSQALGTGATSQPLAF